MLRSEKAVMIKTRIHRLYGRQYRRGIGGFPEFSGAIRVIATADAYRIRMVGAAEVPNPKPETRTPIGPTVGKTVGT